MSELDGLRRLLALLESLPRPERSNVVPLRNPWNGEPYRPNNL